MLERGRATVAGATHTAGLEESLVLPYPRSVRGERLIAFGRVAFASVALIAIYLDPDQPARHPELGYALLAAYLGWAVGAAWISRRLVRVRRAAAIAMHAIDLALVAMLMAFTEGQNSPFFIFFTFVLVTAMLRWSWRGVLATAVIGLSILFCFLALTHPDPDASRVVVRAGYLAITAAMLGLIGANEAGLRRDLARLSVPPGPAPTPSLPVPDLLAYAAQVFEAPLVLLVWSDPDEPWAFVASWREGNVSTVRETAETLDGAVGEGLEHVAFLSPETSQGNGTLVLHGRAGTWEWQGLPLRPAFRERYGITSVVSAPLPTESFDARLFIAGLPWVTSDHLLLIRVVAAQVAGRFELAAAMQRLRDMSASEERIRLVRDMHDGLLQFLAGAALQLESIRHSLGDRGAAEGDRLMALQRALAAEQRSLRTFVDEIKSPGAPLVAREDEIAAVLDVLSAALQQQWGLSIACTVRPPGARAPAPLLRHLRHMLSEAAANAKRHGNATRLDVEVDLSGHDIVLSIVDDGSGFDFEGRLDLDQLGDADRGPVMLRERVRALGGRLAVTSGRGGARLDIAIPMQAG